MTRRSKRPGRSSAWSSTSGRLVAASTITPSREEKPSISVRIWFSVCSRSSLPPKEPVPRARPIASSSSMKMMAGAASRACLNRSRTRLAPTPTIISTNSLAPMLKNGTLASPATARASSVLPVPGAPTSSTPFGTAPPRRVYLAGSLQEIDDLFELVLGLVDAGHVGEGDARQRLRWSGRSAWRGCARGRTVRPSRPAGSRRDWRSRRTGRSAGCVGPKLSSSVCHQLRGSSSECALMVTLCCSSSVSRPGSANCRLHGLEQRRRLVLLALLVGRVGHRVV